MEKQLINCSILTPERLVYEGDIDSAVVHADDGEMGFLYGHAPLVSKLGVGEIRITMANAKRYFVVEGGLVEINDNKLIILAENAIPKEELNTVELESKLSELESSIASAKEVSADRSQLTIESQKVKARLKLSKK